MKKVLLAIFLASVTTFVSTSCSDFLEADNKAAVDAEPYFATEEGQAALRISMYNSIKPMVNDVNLTEWGTDLYTITQTARDNDYQTYKITPEDGNIEGYYKNAYYMINQANCLAKYGAGNPKYLAEAKFLRSFGYYLLVQQFGPVPYVTEYIDNGKRDYPRTPLNEIYKSLISELEGIAEDAALPAEDRQGNVSRRAVKALLAKVCLAAGWDLDTQLTDAAKGTYSITSTENFAKAARYADEAIAGQALTMSFSDKWSPYNEGNEEEIWSVQYDRAGYPGDVLNGGNQRQNTYGSQLGDPITSGLKSCSGVLVPNPKAIYLWEKGDERFEATFMTTMYNYFPDEHPWPTSGYYAYYNASAEAQAALGITERYFAWYTTEAEIEQYISENQARFAKGTAPNTTRVHYIAEPATIWEFNDNGTVSKKTTGSYASIIRQYISPTLTVKKFDDPNTVQQGGVSNCYRDIVVFHLSEMYLTAAEAYLMAGNEGKALGYVNNVRDRAHASHLTAFSDYRPDYTVSSSFGAIRPIDVILDERAREVWAETTRWADLHRTKQLVKYNIEFNNNISSAADMSNVRGDVKWYKPIPAAEIATNAAMTDDDQNAGY